VRDPARIGISPGAPSYRAAKGGDFDPLVKLVALKFTTGAPFKLRLGGAFDLSNPQTGYAVLARSLRKSVNAILLNHYDVSIFLHITFNPGRCISTE
jgi:hypothetical protein